MNDFMTKILGLNWRSTVLGLIGATGNIVNDYLQGKMDWKTFVISFFMALVGFILKDAKVTGTELNPRAQVLGLPDPPPTPAAEVKIAAVIETKK